MTIFGQSDDIDVNIQNINDLPSAKCGRNIPAGGGQGHWLLQIIIIHNNFCSWMNFLL